MLRLPQVIFFDAAGTLIRVAEPVGQTYARIALQHGLQAEAAELEKSFRAAWKQMAPPHGVQEDDDRSWWHALVEKTFRTSISDALFDQLYAHYASAEAWHLFDEVIPTLQLLHQHSRLWVLSNFDKRLRHILAGHGIDSLFEGIIISSEVGVAKPDARIFTEALRQGRVTAEQALHVGDEARADAEGASSAGMECFLLQRPEVDLTALTRKLGF
jgi:putative hydrolase of the HAD superfamily